MDKKELRSIMRAKIAAMSPDDKMSSSVYIANEVKRHLAVAGARVVALYSPLSSEPLLWPLVEELSGKIVVVLPKVEGDVMNFYCYDPQVMVSGAFGIMEPHGGEPISPYEIDVAIVPGFAFTKDGARMGRGKGYYDKYLSQATFRGLKIGVCYAGQIVEGLPVEQHDVVMDYVIYK